MINLYDYFSPLNLNSIAIFLSFIFISDVLGFRVFKLFSSQIPYFLRGVVWLAGMSVIVFGYFVMHFFVPYNSILFPIGLASFLLINLKYYFSQKGHLSIYKYLISNRLPIAVLLIVLPKVIIKSSLPPYLWDEMAYHYISPFTLNFEKTWQVTNSFYQNLPRLLETLYIALFSLTKSYSISRLIHFFIFVSSLLSAYVYLHRKLNIFAAIIFFIAILFHSENFLLWSTLGYVDVGTSSFMLISIICFIELFAKRSVRYLIYMCMFMGLAIGSKYSALSQLVSMSIVGIIYTTTTKFDIKFDIKLLMKLFAVVVIAGGYWYVKNLFFTGNPIYPFVFDCKFEVCEDVSLAYTTPINIDNIKLIFSKVFLNNIVYQSLFVLSCVLTIVMGTNKTKNILRTLTFVVILEALLVSTISGYESRYFHHWQIYSFLILVLPISYLKLPKSS